jgi:hypothetical protein
MDNRSILLKGLRLENCIKDYLSGGSGKKGAYMKFESVWGTHLADHFLSKYSDAKSLIYALDDENLALFVKLF